MDKVIRYEWHGNIIILTLLCVLVFTVRLAVVYFMSKLLRIETQVSDATKLSEYLDAPKRSLSAIVLDKKPR